MSIEKITRNSLPYHMWLFVFVGVIVFRAGTEKSTLFPKNYW